MTELIDYLDHPVPCKKKKRRRRRKRGKKKKLKCDLCDHTDSHGGTDTTNSFGQTTSTNVKAAISFTNHCEPAPKSKENLICGTEADPNFSAAELSFLQTLGWSEKNRDDWEAEPLPNQEDATVNVIPQEREKCQQSILSTWRNFCDCEYHRMQGLLDPTLLGTEKLKS